VDRNVPHWVPDVDVTSEDHPHAFHRTEINHRSGASRYLFRRLKQEPYGCRK
jgi:hypothetical protein